MGRKKRYARNRVTTLDEELTAVLRTMGKRGNGVHPEIWARWHEIAGAQMYQRSFPRFYHRGILTIGVSNSAWLQQISMLRPRLMDRLDETVGPGVVKEIRLVQDSRIGTNIPIINLSQQPVAPASTARPEDAPAEIIAAANDIDDKDLAASILRAAATYLKK